MKTNEWPAEDYAIGSYIQATVSDMYLPQIHIPPHSSVLDIGCGDGSYSMKIIQQSPLSAFIGLDRSENMLHLARNRTQQTHILFERGDVATMKYRNQFDYILSFWCLQWVHDLYGAFQNIYQALKEDGQFFALFPSGDDALIHTYLKVKASNQFPVLNQFIPPVDYPYLKKQLSKLHKLPFKKLHIELKPHTITLPTLTIFQKFLQGVPFYQGQVPEQDIQNIHQAMVDIYARECAAKYEGEYLFHFRTYVVTAQK